MTPITRGRLGMVLLVLAGSLLWSDWAAAERVDVRVQGLSGAEEKNVLALLGIYQEREDKNLSTARILALHRSAPKQIREALSPFGLYRVRVQDQLTPPGTGKDAWVATYQVDPGAPVRIGSVDYEITGPGAESDIFPKTFPMPVGAVLLHADYTKAKDDIDSIAAENGYLDARLVRHEVVVDLSTYQADVYFHLDTGPQYYLGKVTFQQDLLADSFLNRFVRFKPGDVYNAGELLALKGQLLGMQYYDKVEVNPQKQLAGDNAEVPIVVIAERNEANRYRLGLGFATDVGPRLTLDYRRRYIGPYGHKLKADAKLSTPVQTLTLEYVIPVGDPVRDSIIIKPQYGFYDTDTRQGTMFRLEMAWSRITPSGWRRDIGLNYQLEDFKVSDQENSSFNGLVPNIAWSRIVADNPINPRKGYRVKALLQGSINGLLSDASWYSALLKVKWIQSFGQDYRFITRADLGATLASSLHEVPASKRFFAGGDNSIRGWGYDVLGPSDPITHETLGGRYLAVGSLELQRRIKGKLSGSVFTDFGNAFDPDYTAEWEQSAGVGLNYETPLGQVRLDLAYALTKRTPGFRLHLVIGPDL